METCKNNNQLFDLLPNEIIVNTLIFIDAETLFNCRLVCKRWKELIDAYVFQEKVAQENKFINNGQGYKSFSQVNSNDIRKLDLPWYVFYTISKYDPFNRNLMKNHCGQDEWNHWRSVTNMIWSLDGEPDMFNLSCIQQIPQNERYVLSDPDFEGQTSCFVIDFRHLQTINQKIIFKDYGLNEIVMKTLRPTISFSAWYYKIYNRSSIYKLRATVHSRTNEVIGICENFNIGQQTEFEWNKVSHSFETQGDETSLILHHSMFDLGYSHMLYNFKMSCSVVKILLPIKYKNVNSLMHI